MDGVLPPDKDRFIIELEFVQSLANPEYLHWLAQNKYLENEAFLQFLSYLKYWKRKEYSRYILYPHALAVLDLLEEELFRKEMVKANFKDFFESQQFLHWKYYFASRRAHKTFTGGTWSSKLNEPASDSASDEKAAEAAPPVVKTEEAAAPATQEASMPPPPSAPIAGEGGVAVGGVSVPPKDEYAGGVEESKASGLR